jgi:FMN reductase
MGNSETKKPPVRITAVCGSLTAGGTTHHALQAVLAGAREFDAETRLLELRAYQLPFYAPEADITENDDVRNLTREIAEAGAVILGTPEYHGCLSGALKNFLDVLDRGVWETKIVGLVGVAGGATGAVLSLNALAQIGRNLHTWVLPHQVSIPEAHRQFNADGSVVDPGLEARLHNLGAQAVKFAALQRHVRDDEFARAWAKLPTW